MIVDEDVVLLKNDVEDDNSQLNANNKNDDMSSLTVEDPSNICTDYFDTPNSRNYFKKNFEDTKKVNGPSYLVGLALCNTSSAYKHISIDEIDVHLVIAKFVTSLKRSQKCQFALILNLINEKRMNDLSQRMDVTEKNDDDKKNCDDKVSRSC